MTRKLRSRGCDAAAVVLACGAVAFAGREPAETRPLAGRQVWQIPDGTATFNLDRGVAAESIAGAPRLEKGNWRRPREQGGPVSSSSSLAANQLRIEPGSQIVVSWSDGRLAVVGGLIALTNGVQLSSGLATRSLSDAVIRPEDDADGQAFRLTDAAAADGEGLLLRPAQVRIDRSQRMLLISTDEVRLTARLAEALGRSDLTGETAGGVIIRARYEPVDARPPALQVARPLTDLEGGIAGVIGPDVTVWTVGAAANYGVIFDPVRNAYISAFAIATRSCNEGDEPAVWIENTNEHPVIAQNMYRLRNDRFEQIGMSWVKHAFFATRENACGICQDPCPDPCLNPDGRSCANPADDPPPCCPLCANGSRLGVQCSDLYAASLNGQQYFLGPRSQINGFNGAFPYPFTAPPYDDVADRRLQVRNTDLDVVANAGALYYVEGQYVTTDEPAFDNQHNNVSYQRALVLPEDDNFCRPCSPDACPDPGFCINVVSTATHREQPAIRAWKANDDSVVETDLRVPDATLGQEGFMVLAAKAFEVGSGLWRYEYALQNVTSDRSVGSFSVPLPTGAALTNIGFHDVEYHSGEPFDGTDWAYEITSNAITWATAPYSEDSNANALRWGTLYNFRFDANVSPEVSKDPRPVTVTLGLFKPGDPPEAQVKTIGPSTGFIDCQPNGITDRCDIACSMDCPEPCGGSLDCNDNQVPDECEPDCNGNGTADECDILSGESEDCDVNGVPDECDPDCDDDGTIDACETVFDTDGDCVLDCEDLCPASTPAGECCCEDLCCFDSGICLPGFTADQCLALDPPGVPTCVDEPCRYGCLIGDGDGDADFDLRDAGGLLDCFSGAAGGTAFVAPTDECRRVFDFNDDGDVDLGDAGRFLDILLGPGDPPP